MYRDKLIIALSRLTFEYRCDPYVSVPNDIPKMYYICELIENRFNIEREVKREQELMYGDMMADRVYTGDIDIDSYNDNYYIDEDDIE